MKHTIVLLLAVAGAAAAQTGVLKGTVTDESGSPIAGARVSASVVRSMAPLTLAANQRPSFLPAPADGATGPKGEFQVSGLSTATYTICVDVPGSDYLNPCFWSDQLATVEAQDGATASGVTIFLAKGVRILFRIDDPTGLLADPSVDDVYIGASHGKFKFIPAQLYGRDAAGKTVGLAVPRGQAASVTISSKAFGIQDNQGKGIDGSSAIAVPAATTSSTTPVLTFRVAPISVHGK